MCVCTYVHVRVYACVCKGREKERWWNIKVTVVVLSTETLKMHPNKDIKRF